MKLRYKIGIASKIIFMVTAIILAAISVVVYIATDLYTEESVTRVQEMNQNTAQGLSKRTLSVFQESIDKMTLMAQFATNTPSFEEAQRAIKNTLDSSDSIISFMAFKYTEDKKWDKRFQVLKPVAEVELGLSAEQLHRKTISKISQHIQQSPNEVYLFNSSPLINKPMFTMAFLSKSKISKGKNSQFSNRWLFRVDMTHDKVVSLFEKKGASSSFLVDASGSVMAHSDPNKSQWVLQATNLQSHPLIGKMLSSKIDNQQMSFFVGDKEYFGAFDKVGIAGSAVITEVSREDALATISRVQYRSFLVMLIVVCLAFIVNFSFSQSLIRPLKLLFQATQNIVQGKFDVQLKVKSSDEIGALSKAFNSMADGLKERDKIKGAFAKFHSKEVAEKLLSGEIKLGGERRQATVFFSDIRSFTALSEKMTPDEVVAMLNEYMTEMVRIIFKWEGVVDKYIGDAIMAVWGVPESTPDDAYKAVRACLEMREYLVEFNENRKAEGKPEINIGMGLHSGEVLSGNIGSEERLEYTVIGDTVNQASRIEASTKNLKTDLLISDATQILAEEKEITFGSVVEIRAKGKTDALKVFPVIGYKDESGVEQTSLSEDQVVSLRNLDAFVDVAEESKTQIVSKSDIDSAPLKLESISNKSNNSDVENNKNVIEEKELDSNHQKLIDSSTENKRDVISDEDSTEQQVSAHELESSLSEKDVLESENVETETEGLDYKAPSVESIQPNDQESKSLASEFENFPVESQSIDEVEENIEITDKEVSVSETSSPATMDLPSAPQHPEDAPEKPENVKEWYVVDDPGSKEYQGPFSLNDIKLKVHNNQIDYHSSYVFKKGDSQMLPITQLTGIERRTEESVIDAPLPTSESDVQAPQDGWYVHGKDAKAMGPYSEDQLAEALEKNHLSRTTYVWKPGMDRWIHLYQIPGFDRRQEAG